MSAILTYGIWLTAFITAFVAGINLLPSASQYPVPVEISQAIATIWGYLNAWNQILPIDTLFTVLYWGIIIRILTRIVYPGVFYIWKTIVRANP